MKVLNEMLGIVLRKRALQKIIAFKEQQISGTWSQLSAILEENKNLDIF